MCSVCAKTAAVVYCVNDDANLCQGCDDRYHSPEHNPLAARHERRKLPVSGDVGGCAASGTSGDVAVVPQFLAEESLGGKDMGLFDDIFSVPDLNDTGFVDIDNLCVMGDVNEDPFGLDDIDCVVPSVYYGQTEEQQYPQFTSGMVREEKPVQRMVDMNDISPMMMVPQTVMGDAVCDGQMASFGNIVEEDAGLEEEYEESEYDSIPEEDPNDTDFYVAPRRAHGTRRSKRSAAVSFAVANACSDEPELTREERVARYRAKRARRSFQKTIRYQSRKAYAEIRPRIKGRFVSHEEYAEYMATQEPEAVVPAC